MRKIQLLSFASLFAIILLWVILLPSTIELTDYSRFAKSDFIMIFVVLLLSYSVLVKNKFTFDDTGFVLLSIIYVGMGFFYFSETRAAGLANIFYVLFVVWATDTGAYFFGRAYGKHKLWPEISPKKTIEGALGGVLLAVVVGIIFHLVHPFDYSIWIIIGVTILVSVFGQLGDLVESAFKRHYQVKDSGKLLPGHGGILDRFDSLLFVFPMLYFIHFF